MSAENFNHMEQGIVEAFQAINNAMDKIKEFIDLLDNKVDTKDLKTVAFSGSYSDLSDKPEIPTVNNAKLTIQKNGTAVKTFTANASADVTANITVPTKVSELTNDSGYKTTDTTYSNFVKSGTGAKSGLVPAPSTTAGTTKYLREDGTWQVPPDNNTVYTHPTTSGNKHIPSGGSSGQILRWSADGTATWGADNNTTYSDFVKSGTGAKSGLVPAPSTTAGTTKYLREDGTWQVPPDNNTVYTHPTTSGNKHIPSGGSSGQILRWSADGTATWGADNNTTYSNFVKSGTGAKSGLVPAPSTTAGTTKYLREDGTWQVPPDNNTTYSNMTAATASAAGKAGLVPAPAAGKQSSFLRGDGTWVVPTDTNTDTKVTQTNTTTDAAYRLIFSGNANDTTETTTTRKSSKFTANPSTGVFSSPKLSISGTTSRLYSSGVWDTDTKQHIVTIANLFKYGIVWARFNIWTGGSDYGLMGYPINTMIPLNYINNGGKIQLGFPEAVGSSSEDCTTLDISKYTSTADSLLVKFSGCMSKYYSLTLVEIISVFY